MAYRLRRMVLVNTGTNKFVPSQRFAVIGGDRDDVNRAARLDRIVDEMGVAPEPKMDQRLAKFRRDLFRRNQAAPGGAATKAGRLIVP